jgi:predicted transcriptional regulator
MLGILHSMIGDSGRIVVEVDPDLKRRLHSALALEHQSLKDWFIDRAMEYVRAQLQPNLFADEQNHSPRH